MPGHLGCDILPWNEGETTFGAMDIGYAMLMGFESVFAVIINRILTALVEGLVTRTPSVIGLGA